MFKFLLYAALIYLGYKLYRGMSLIAGKGNQAPKHRQKDLYDKLDIRDADYEDLDDNDTESK